MKKSILALVLAMAMIAGLVGCGSSGGGKAEDSTQAAAPAAGGSDLKVMIETGVESLDPQVATDGTSCVAKTTATCFFRRVRSQSSMRFAKYGLSRKTHASSITSSVG